MTALYITVTTIGHGWFPERFPTLPVTIVDADGQVKARGSVPTQSSCTISFEAGTAPLFATLQLPNGRAAVKALLRDGVWLDRVMFEIGAESPREWMAWSTMRFDLRGAIGALMEQPGMEDAWLQLWELHVVDRHWTQAPIHASQMTHFSAAIQFDLPVSVSPRTLVARLGAGSPQVISLPTRQGSTVLVTRAHSLATDGEARVLVGGYGPDAEGILEFLRKGALGAIDTVLDVGSEMAHRLLQDKVSDPIAATAAAYYLIQKRDWTRMPQQWLANLCEWFPWIPDAHLIRDVSQIQRGMRSKDAPALAARSLQDALSFGLPFFAAARPLMEELLSYAEKAEGLTVLDPAQAALVRGMLAAPKAAGLTFGFAGTSPAKPLSGGAAFSVGRNVRGDRKLRTLSRETTYTYPLGSTAGERFESLRHMQIVADEGMFGALAARTVEPDMPGDRDQTLFLRDVLRPPPRTAELAPVQVLR